MQTVDNLCTTSDPSQSLVFNLWPLIYNFVSENEVSILECIILLQSSSTSASSPNPEMTVAALSCHCCSSCLPSLASPGASIESSLASIRSLLGSVAARLPRVSTKNSDCDVSSVLSPPPATSNPTDLRYMSKSHCMVVVSRTRKRRGTSVREEGVSSERWQVAVAASAFDGVIKPL